MSAPTFRSQLQDFELKLQSLHYRYKFLRRQILHRRDAHIVYLIDLRRYIYEKVSGAIIAKPTPSQNKKGVRLPMTREAYEQAYNEGRQYTLRFLLSRGVAQDSAEDIAQTAWLRGWERLGQLRSDELVLAWVNTIALNLYRRLIRQERRFQNLQDPVYTAAGSMNLAAIDLARILGFCPPRDRMLLEAQIGGRTAKEIAKAEGLSQTAIRIRMFRARRAARKAAEALSTRRLNIGIPRQRAA